MAIDIILVLALFVWDYIRIMYLTKRTLYQASKAGFKLMERDLCDKGVEEKELVSCSMFPKKSLSKFRTR